MNRNSVIELAQLQFAIQTRNTISRVLGNTKIVKFSVDCMKGEPDERVYEGVKDWEAKNPGSFSQYQKWQADCMELFYAVLPPFIIFPDWIEKDAMKKLRASLEDLAPFSPNSLSTISDTHDFELVLKNAINSIDQVFLKSGSPAPI